MRSCARAWAAPRLAAAASLAALLWSSACAPGSGASRAVPEASPHTLAAPEPAVRSGQPVTPDPDWTLRRLDGSTFTLGDLRGRPVFVNLWATWCPPCVEELPAIDRLARAVAETGVHFLLVSPEEGDRVRRFSERLALELSPVLEETLAPRAFGEMALPTTAILDARGRMVLLHRGAAAWDDPEIVALLRELAGEGGG